MNDSSSRPPRRVRYSGPNPRNFQDKYKERQPQKYPGEINKVMEGGKTPAGMHRPIMVAEILSALELRPGHCVLDCTLGYGGHARAMLQAVQPGGRLLGMDVDAEELPKTESRLRALDVPAEALVLRRLNFAAMAQFVAQEASEGVDAILADLGVSSMQIDDPSRGFGFKVDGPLDMRMNPGRGRSAADLLSTIKHADLSRLLTENADVPQAETMATAILKAQQRKAITNTQSLVEIVQACAQVLPEDDRDKAVRRIFQALRIAVNDEFKALEAMLRQLPACLKPGGRVAILSFHSGEDRRIKSAFKHGLDIGLYTSVSREVVRASQAEQRSNSRSSSAKLRVAVRSELSHP